MKKADKIKICRAFMEGRDLHELADDVYDLYVDSFGAVNKALRWGLKHPDELRKGK